MNVAQRPIRLLVVLALAFAWALALGRLSAHHVNDTPSYLDYPFDSLRSAMLSIRTPGYPLLLQVVQAILGLAAVPLVQVMLHATASWAFYEELLSRQMPQRSALVAMTCVLMGCTATDHINTISTDAPAASLGLWTLTSLLTATRLQSNASWTRCVVAALLTLSLRPAYLFLVVWMPLCGWLLLKHDLRRGIVPAKTRLRKLILSTAIVVGVLLTWMGARKWMVDEFAIVPFGHQNLSALLVQTVPLQTLRGLDAPADELASRVAEKMEQERFVSPSAAAGGVPTMTMEDQWGRLNYEIIYPAAIELESAESDAAIPLPVRVHRRIGSMNRAIVLASPKGYLRWILLGIRRGAWGTAANMVMHPYFLFLSMATLVGLIFLAVFAPGYTCVPIPEGWSALMLAGVSYWMCGGLFVILTSPPLGRFVDAYGILLPAIAFSLAFHALTPSCSGDSGRDVSNGDESSSPVG